jgi:hypothetical protein
LFHLKNRLKTRVALIELLDLSGIAVGNVGVPTCSSFSFFCWLLVAFPTVTIEQWATRAMAVRTFIDSNNKRQLDRGSAQRLKNKNLMLNCTSLRHLAAIKCMTASISDKQGKSRRITDRQVTVQMLSKCQYRKTGPKILNKVKRASHFVKKIVACPHRLPKLPESTHRKQAIPNKGSLFYSHCGFSCGKNATNFGVNLCKRLRRRSRPSQQKKVDHGNHKLIIVRETVINPIPKTINTRLPLSNPIMWQFEKENVPPKLFFSDTILGMCYVFPVIHIIPLFHSQTNALCSEK